MDMESMTAEQARRNFADLLNEVRFNGKQILITRHGKPVAKLTSVTEEDLDQLAPPSGWRAE